MTKTPLPQVRARRAVLALATAACAMILGCAAWEGDLDPDHNRRVTRRVRDIVQLNLHDQTATPVKTVDDQLETVKERRPTKPETEERDSIQLSLTDLRVKTLRNNLDLDVAMFNPDVAESACEFR